MTVNKKYLFQIIIFSFFLISITPFDTPNKTSNKKINIQPEITISEIQQSYKDGIYTISELTQYYLNRIDSLSFNGPQLNAVITVNPDAMKIANQLDKDMKNGKALGILHGIPILLKDNIDTKDKMPCTAGSMVMKNSFPDQDSPLAEQLRKAGAIILGKANMSEWANFHSNHSSSGWSAVGGQAKNPYELSRNPCGSSSGSAIAVSANLSVLAIGTETNGSIVCPANNNGIVGIKPTVGLISRRGIIPISSSQDTGGPMARTVRDAAICLGTLTEIDAEDNATLASGRIAYTDYTQFLKVNKLKGKRIGYYKKPLGSHKRMTVLMENTVAYFKAQGATIIELNEITNSSIQHDSFLVLLYEFKSGLNSYLLNMGTKAQVSNLEELIKKTFNDSIEMKYHDHELLKLAQSKGDLNSKEYLKALNKARKNSRKEGIDKVMDEHQLDAIIAPTGGPAWKTDLTNGDNLGIFSSSPAAIAGYPNISVPMGQIDGLPVGVSIFGRPWTENILLEIAYSYEQGTQHRITPTFKTNPMNH